MAKPRAAINKGVSLRRKNKMEGLFATKESVVRLFSAAPYPLL